MVKIDSVDAGILGGFTTCTSLLTAGISHICGRSIGMLNGAGFGFVQGVVGKIAFDNMPKFLPTAFHKPLALIAGGFAGYGISQAAAAIGFIASPITVPSAVVLTIVNITLIYFSPCIISTLSKAKAFLPHNKPEATSTVPPHVSAMAAALGKHRNQTQAATATVRTRAEQAVAEVRSQAQEAAAEASRQAQVEALINSGPGIPQ